MRSTDRRWPRNLALAVAAAVLAAAFIAPAGAHMTSSTPHLGKHFKSLSRKGRINARRNPVHWTKLKGVPKMLAKPGLKVQRRVTGTCAPGSAVSGIAPNGAVTCENDDVNLGDVTSVMPGTGLTGGGSAGDLTLGLDPDAAGAAGFFGEKAGGSGVPATPTQLGALSLPAGTYLVTAMIDGTATALNSTMTCQLLMGSDSDSTSISLPVATSTGVMTMTAADTLASAGTAAVSCSGVTTNWSDLRISAVKLTSLTTQAL